LSTTKGNHQSLITFERKILRKIHGPLYNRETEQFERRLNNDLRELYGRLNILSYTRSKRLEWLGHVWRADGRIIKQALIAKITGKRPLGTPRTSWRDSVVKDLRVLQERAQLDIAYNREE